MRVIQLPGWKRPSGYSHGMLAQGRLLVTGGMVGWDEHQEFQSDDLVEQARQALLNTRAVLSEANAEPGHVVRMTWYITDRREYLARLPELGRAYRGVMGRHYPAMAMVQVAALIEDRARVEIETTAVLPDSASRPPASVASNLGQVADGGVPLSNTPGARSKQSLRAWIQMLKTNKQLEAEVGRLFARSHGTTLSRFDVLANLERCPDEASSISNLSQMLLAPRGNITRLLDRMEKDGLIRRRQNARDRRVSEVQMTHLGRELFGRLAPDHEVWADEVFSVLGEENKRELIHLLGLLRVKLRALSDT